MRLASILVILLFPASGALAQTEGEAPTDGDPPDPSMMTDENSLDDQAAREYFLSGRNLYALGRFAEAAAQFQQAYDLSPRKQLLYNLYVAYRDAGDREHAATSLRAYLEQMDEIDPAERTNLEARLRALEEGLAEDTAEREAAARQAEEAARREQAERDRREREQAATASEGGESPVPWIVFGVGAAAMLVGIVTGGVALDARSTLDAGCDANRVCPDDEELVAAYDRGRTMATVTDVLLVAGGVVAIGGFTWGLIQMLSGGGAEAPPVAAHCGPDGCAATFRGTF